MQLITLSFAQDLTGKATYHLTLGEDRHIFVGITRFDANASLFTYKQHPKKVWNIDTNYRYQEVFTDAIGHQVFKPKISGKDIVVRDFYEEGESRYYKDAPDFNWQIANETKVIAGLTCQLAKSNFRGRSYEVWFSKEVPTAAGPWKFGGLPGLIVKVADATGKVNIELVKFEYTEQPLKSPELKYGKWIEMDVLYKLLDKKWEELVKRTKAILAQTRSEDPDLIVTYTPAKRRPATELEFD